MQPNSDSSCPWFRHLDSTVRFPLREGVSLIVFMALMGAFLTVHNLGISHTLLKDKLSCITKNLRDEDGERENLNNLKYKIRKDISSLQDLLQTVESKSKTDLLSDKNQNMVSLCRGYKDLKCFLETDGQTAEPSREVEKQDMTKLMAAIEELRKSTDQIHMNLETTNSLLTSMQRTVSHMNTWIESCLSQRSCAEEREDPLIDNIQELGAFMQPSPKP